MALEAMRDEVGRARIMKKNLSKLEYNWLASGVCLTECVGERALGLPPFADPLQATDADMPAAAKYGDGLLPLLRKKRDDLRALGLPDAGMEIMVLTEALRHFEETVKAFEEANYAAHNGDSEAFKAAWARGRQHDFVADTLFTEFDLPLCAAD